MINQRSLLVLASFFLVFASIVEGVASCGGTPQIPDPKPVPDLPPFEDPTCEDACRKLQSLECQAGEETEDGSSCEEVCENLQESGIVSWDLQCMTEIENCDQVANCD